MATKIFLPRLGESIIEAVVGRWLKQPGDIVARGDVIAELETAKAMMELESPVKGTLLAILPKQGDTVHLDELMAVVGNPGEEWEETEQPSPVAPESVQHDFVVNEVDEPIRKSSTEIRKLISPNAKRIAKQLGMSAARLNQIEKAGRITGKDVKEVVGESIISVDATLEYIKIPLNQIQSITAHRMTQSAFNVPQFSVSVDVNAERLIDEINRRKSAGENKVTITTLITWKTAEALSLHPRLNSRFDEDSVFQFKDINIAIAVDAPDGLFVPVIHQADRLSVDAIADAIVQLTSRAKNKRLELNDTQAGTFTISNLGMKGITSFVPLVDPAQTAILGVGALREGVGWDQNSILKRTRIFTLTVVADHRVVGGAEVSDFLVTLKNLIETI